MPLQGTYGNGSARGFGRFASRTDPYSSSISLLLHCDGVNAGGTFTDSGPFATTVTRNNAAGTYTAAAKFGSAGMRTRADGDGCTLPNSHFAFGTADFTVEAWIYFDGVQVPIAGAVVFANSTTREFSAQYGTSISNFTFYGSNGPTDSVGWAHGMAIGSWNHVAWVRQGSKRSIFVNGVLIGSATDVSGISFSPGVSTDAWIAMAPAAPNHCISGYLDELRITNSVARYTGTFSPPTAAF